MNKLISVLLILMAFSSNLAAFSVYEEALSDISHVQGASKEIAMEMAESVEIDGQSWKTLSGETEGETFKVQLPNQRLFSTIKNGWGATIAKKDGVHYEVASAVPAMKNVNGDSVMYQLASRYSKEPYELQNGSITSENGHQVIEVIAYNTQTNEIERVKAIGSGNNLHIAMVKFPADQDTSNDEIFLGSFSLLD